MSIALVQSVCQTFEKQILSQMLTDKQPYPIFWNNFHTILKVLKCILYSSREALLIIHFQEGSSRNFE